MGARGLSWFMVPVVFATAGCEQPLEDRPCPCSEGWTCSPRSKLCVVSPATQLIDDMHGTAADETEADGTGVNGYWYTYSDKTVPNSLPVRYAWPDAGLVSPSEDDTHWLPTNDGDGPVVDGTGIAQPYRRVDAGGETHWGVGFGMDFLWAPPNGGPIPVDECDAGEIWAPSNNIPQPFDASQWTGIQFYARSFGDEDVAVEVHIDDDRTSPWGQVPLAAGGCNACVSSGSNDWACSDSFSNISTPDPSLSTPITFSHTKWSLVWVPFSSLHSGNWAHILQATDPIHTNKIYNLHFQISTTNDAAIMPFSIGVGYVSLYKL